MELKIGLNLACTNCGETLEQEIVNFDLGHFTEGKITFDVNVHPCECCTYEEQ